jgi:hypothetical protein
VAGVHPIPGEPVVYELVSDPLHALTLQPESTGDVWNRGAGAGRLKYHAARVCLTHHRRHALSFVAE